MGAGLLHRRAFFFFQVFPLISVSQSSCPVPMRDWAFLWRIRDEGPEGSPLPLESVTPKQIDRA